MIELNQPKVIRAWTFYDWANSAYSLIITSAIFPAYYSAIAPDTISFFEHSFRRASVASYAIALSFLIVAIISPILSSIADYKGNKKFFMKAFCYMGSFACIAMFFFKKDNNGIVNYNFGLFCSILASIGYCGSIVFYNAFLPEIASKSEQDSVSAKGFSMGYIGSVLLMILCFGLILADKYFLWNLDSLTARISFLAVGFWWIGFAQISFKKLQETPRNHKVYKNILTGGYTELLKVWKSLEFNPQLKKFLISFFFYNMGVQTVMYMATYFASDELHMETTQLLAVVLIIQLVAIIGARLFAWVSSKLGNIFAIAILIIIWIGICITAYFVQSVNAFYGLAFAVGMVMGGIQSLSRSTYSKLLPNTEDTASYFSFYDVCDKIGIVIGTLSFGLIADLSEKLKIMSTISFGIINDIPGSMRNSTLVLCLYFLVGIILLFRISQKSFKEKI
jgi:UMF1 family MFS transporter